ncbi:TraB/GumN family protein [Winogradskyella haliclonae]|uniref:Lipoprotein n=1 Tax=Winogradskyella haliclonae TaxID=2048558 RepID=A0ABQ2C3N0_9FLAO|nr:TraB/GumN family protein [Winogradskyella haliclonae]GGI58377.1 lipoprotein [Winogradskyella haliclonae]
MKKIKTLCSAILVAIISIFTGNAQELENSTLWKITGNGLEQPSYLFGTIHITCDATLDDDVKKALDETTQVVLELDMDSGDMQTKMMQNMYMKDGQTLKDLVSEEDYKAIDQMFKKHMGMSVEMMQNMKPFFLTAALYPNLIDCPMQSFEEELLKVAKKQGEDIKGLETIEDQLNVFDKIPYKEQAKDLVRSAKDDLAYDKATFSKMMDTYKKEDITEMIDMMNDENYSSIAEYQDILLDNRNKNWIPKIGEFAKEQPTFFGVGAGHLAGKNGVIKLLRKEGYTVEAVK